MKSRKEILNRKLKRALRRLGIFGKATLYTKSEGEDNYLKKQLDLDSLNYKALHNSNKVILTLTKKGLEAL